jgi:hypothetical protein
MYWVVQIEAALNQSLRESRDSRESYGWRARGERGWGREAAADGAHILPLHALCARDLQQRSMSRPGTACRPRPSSWSLLPRLHPSLSPIGHAPLRLPVTRLMTVHVRICLCLKYMPLSLARLYASHTGVAVGSGRAAQPGATGGACHTSKDTYSGWARPC